MWAWSGPDHQVRCDTNCSDAKELSTIIAGCADYASLAMSYADFNFEKTIGFHVVWQFPHNLADHTRTTKPNDRCRSFERIGWWRKVWNCRFGRHWVDSLPLATCWHRTLTSWKSIWMKSACSGIKLDFDWTLSGAVRAAAYERSFTHEKRAPMRTDRSESQITDCDSR